MSDLQLLVFDDDQFVNVAEKFRYCRYGDGYYLILLENNKPMKK